VQIVVMNRDLKSCTTKRHMFMQITSIKLSRKLSQFLSDWFKTNSITMLN